MNEMIPTMHARYEFLCFILFSIISAGRILIARQTMTAPLSRRHAVPSTEGPTYVPRPLVVDHEVGRVPATTETTSCKERRLPDEHLAYLYPTYPLIGGAGILSWRMKAAIGASVQAWDLQWPMDTSRTVPNRSDFTSRTM